MTNIEFLVNELRKANETISSLRKEKAKLKEANKFLISNNQSLSERVRVLTDKCHNANVTSGEEDVLAVLKKQLGDV